MAGAENTDVFDSTFILFVNMYANVVKQIDNLQSITNTMFYKVVRINQSELQIWSLQISNLERISVRNCVLTFLEHYQSTQHG
jgi:hypothetical protein